MTRRSRPILSGLATCQLLALLLAAGAARTAAAQLNEPQSDDGLNEKAQRIADEQANYIRRLVSEFAARARQTADMITTVESRAKALRMRMDQLLTSDEGKRLARASDNIRTFIRLRDEPSLSPDEAAAKKNAIDAIVAGLERELARESVKYNHRRFSSCRDLRDWSSHSSSCDWRRRSNIGFATATRSCPET